MPATRKQARRTSLKNKKEIMMIVWFIRQWCCVIPFLSSSYAAWRKSPGIMPRKQGWGLFWRMWTASNCTVVLHDQLEASLEITNPTTWSMPHQLQTEEDFFRLVSILLLSNKIRVCMPRCQTDHACWNQFVWISKLMCWAIFDHVGPGWQRWHEADRMNNKWFCGAVCAA